MKNNYLEWFNSEYLPKLQSITKDYKKPNGYVEPPPPQVENTISTVQAHTPEPAPEYVMNKTYIQDAAPDYPNYTFEGCWASGNNTQYPILKKMVIHNVFNMNDCVKNISQAGLQSAAYNGKNLCVGGGPEYAEYTSSKCDDTYTKGKSWLVYSKNN